jgi:aminopeptidase N
MASSIYFYRRQGCFAYSLLKQITTELDYKLDDETLTLLSLSDRFTLEIESNPSANTELSGLYMPGSGFFTQCEAEGFRKITY